MPYDSSKKKLKKYMVEKRILTVEFFLNFYSMLQDSNLKIPIKPTEFNVLHIQNRGTVENVTNST